MALSFLNNRQANYALTYLAAAKTLCDGVGVEIPNPAAAASIHAKLVTIESAILALGPTPVNVGASVFTNIADPKERLYALVKAVNPHIGSLVIFGGQMSLLPIYSLSFTVIAEVSAS